MAQVQATPQRASIGRATPMEHISTPPSGEVEWRFHLRHPRPGEYGVIIYARSWFAARDLAAAALGVSRDDVEVVR